MKNKSKNRLKIHTMDRRIFVGAGLFVLFTIGIASYHWATQPNKTKTNEGAQSSGGTVVYSPKQLATAYFSATIPSGYTISSKTENATAQDLLQIKAAQPKVNGRQISIHLAAVGIDGINSIAGYRNRLATPETYTKIEFGGMPIGVPTFYSRADASYEITGYWVRGGLYADISVSGVSSEQREVNQDYAALLGSWNWR